MLMSTIGAVALAGLGAYQAIETMKNYPSGLLNEMTAAEAVSYTTGITRASNAVLLAVATYTIGKTVAQSDK